MSGHDLSALSPLKRALLARQVRAQYAATLRADPIAIIGMGCRLPGGANDPEAFWRLLRDGVDAVREVPADRWDADASFDPDPAAPGKAATKWGGFLDAVDGFDAAYFSQSALIICIGKVIEEVVGCWHERKDKDVATEGLIEQVIEQFTCAFANEADTAEGEHACTERKERGGCTPALAAHISQGEA